MPRSSTPCPHCDLPLNLGTDGLFLNARGQPVNDWRKAIGGWKTCCTCSKVANKHVFLRFPEAFGGEGTRTHASGKVDPQNNCQMHRKYRDGRQLHAAERSNLAEQRECTSEGVVVARPSLQVSTSGLRSMRDVIPLHHGGNARWSEDDYKAFVQYQVAMLLDAEGQRRMVEHVRLERSPANRRRFLAKREAEGRLTCEACEEDLALKYTAEFSNVVEVHHREPLWKRVTRPTYESLVLLCPTCHRIVHYKQREPRDIEQVRALVRRRRKRM